MKKFANRFKVASVLLAFATILTSCLKDNEPVIVGPLTYQVINAVPGSTGQDIYQGNQRLNTAAINFGDPTLTVTGISGYSSLSFANSGTTVVNAYTETFLTAGSVFNMFYSDTPAGQQRIFGYQNNQTKPASTKVKLRFIHLANGVPSNLNVTNSSGGTVLADIQFSREYSYVELDALSNLIATVNGSLETTPISGSDFIGGNNYTIWFSAASASKVNYHVIKDNTN